MVPLRRPGRIRIAPACALVLVGASARVAIAAEGAEAPFAGPVESLAALGLLVALALAATVGLRRLDRRLREARLEAEAANLAKARYVSFLGHEIRAPLNVVLAHLRVLEDEATSDAQRSRIETIRAASESLLALVNDVLTFSRLESGPWTLREEVFSPEDEIRGVVAFYRQAADAKGLALTVETDPSLPAEVFADPACLRQILANLLSNALKFTAAGEIQVEAGARRAADADSGARSYVLSIRVRDSGIGIEPEAIDRLFRPYEQADGAAVSRYGGAGLGLAIVRHLARTMGGDVTVDSRPGIGSSFTVTVRASEPRQGSLAFDERAAG